MRIAQITPGLIEIPPKRWGAIEKIIWNYKIELELSGHTVDILYLDDVIENHKEYDIIHVHVANLCDKLIEYNIPYYFTLHDHHVVLFDEMYNNNKRAIDNAEYAFVPAKYLVKLFDNTPVYIPHGVNIEKYYKVDRDISHKEITNLSLLCVGNNVYSHTNNKDRKGFSYAIEAAKKLNCDITIAGPYKDEGQSNKYFFEEFLDKNLYNYDKLHIIKNPSEEDIIKLYQSHDIFVHPSELEAGHPNLTLVEAAATGLPIVGTIEQNYEGIYRINIDIDRIGIVKSIINGIYHIYSNYSLFVEDIYKFAYDLQWKKVIDKLLIYYKNEDNSMKKVLMENYNQINDINRNINNDFFYAPNVDGEIVKYNVDTFSDIAADNSIKHMYNEIFIDKIYTKYANIDKNSVILDIGANIGLFSLFSSKLGAKKIIAVEPEKNNFNLLKKNRPKNTLLYHRAVTDITNDTIDLYIDSTVGGHSLIKEDINNTKTGESQSVMTISIDDIIKENNIEKVDILKIDTEGSEDLILGGISEYNFRKIKYVVLEYHHMKYGFSDDKYKQFVNNMTSYGFSLTESIDLGTHLKIMYFSNDNILDNTKDEYKSKLSINYNFINGSFLEVKGNVPDDKSFNVKFINDKNDEVIYQDNIKSNHWVKSNKQFYVPYTLQVVDNNNGDILFDKHINLKNKRVLISLDSKSLGDTIAWFPYVDEFRKKHQCKVFVSTFWNDLFDKRYYNEITFINPGTSVENVYAQYNIGIHGDGTYDKLKNPVDTRKVSLQKIASEYLGLEHKEIKPVLRYKRDFNNIVNDKFTFAIHSTSQAKYWNYPGGWDMLCKTLKEKYNIKGTLLSKEPSGYMGNHHPHFSIINDKSGDYPMEDRIFDLLESKFFIGISSGLSWLAWALNVPVVLVSGFTDPFYEPTSNIYRVHNDKVCHGCWHNHIFDKGDWNWCPVHKDTERQFECTKSITPDMIIDTIKSNNLIS